MRNKKLIPELITALLVLLFLHTAISKILDLDGFARDLNNQPFPNSLTPFLLWLLPLSEMVIAVALLFEKTRSMGLYASLVLMSLFTMYTALVLLHVFAYVPCSCGGVVSYLSWPQHLIFNLFFTSITYWAITLQKNKADPELKYTQ
ncbi:methylamine utilization protein MauE [Chryseobacterium sp. 52]|nr:methylamine utilization protein MauE [Chryseobacterium sp. 52]